MSELLTLFKLWIKLTITIQGYTKLNIQNLQKLRMQNTLLSWYRVLICWIIIFFLYNPEQPFNYLNSSWAIILLGMKWFLYRTCSNHANKCLNVWRINEYVGNWGVKIREAKKLKYLHHIEKIKSLQKVFPALIFIYL